MWTGLWELVVKYDDGEVRIYEYSSEERAEKGKRHIETALGNQVSWSGIRQQMERRDLN